MNIPLMNFCLFLLWSGMAVFLLLFVPTFFPGKNQETWRLLGAAVAVFAVWSFVKWWGQRQSTRAGAFRREVDKAFRRRIRPPEEKKQMDNQIVCPDFQFEDPGLPKTPPAHPRAGSDH
jgi:hypothetical protein